MANMHPARFPQFGVKSGEALIEVVIALSVLMITLGYSGSVISTGISQIGNSQNRVIATSLAQEGLEAVRNIIGSNLLRFPEEQEICWNAAKEISGANGIELTAVESAGECDTKIGSPENTLAQTFRVIIKRTSGTFSLIYMAGDAFSSVWNNPAYGLYAIDSNGAFIAAADDVTDKKLMLADCAASPSCDPAALAAFPPKYYRAIQIRYDDSDGDATNDYIEVTSYVAWGAGTRDNVRLSTIISSSQL